jgi:hypothetical protein
VVDVQFCGFIHISIEEVPGTLLRIEGKAAFVFGILWIGVFWLLSGWTIWDYFLIEIFIATIISFAASEKKLFFFLLDRSHAERVMLGTGQFSSITI